MDKNHPPVNYGKTGVLIINLGTPDSTNWFDIRKYLKEFLSDKRVIEVNPIIWQIILNLFIFLYIMIWISLILLVLLQQGKGSDIGSAFGGGSSNAMFGSSGPSNPLTKATAIVSAIFLILSLFITYISRNTVEQDIDIESPVIEETGILPDNNPE